MQPPSWWLQLHSITSSLQIGTISDNNKSHWPDLLSGYKQSLTAMLLTCSLDMCHVILGEHRYWVTCDCGAHILGSNTVFLPCLIQPFIWWYILGCHQGLLLKIESSICESFRMMKTTTFTNRGGKYTGKVQANPFCFPLYFFLYCKR